MSEDQEDSRKCAVPLGCTVEPLLGRKVRIRLVDGGWLFGHIRGVVYYHSRDKSYCLIEPERADLGIIEMPLELTYLVK